MRNGGVSRMTQSYRIVQQYIKYPMDRVERKGGREGGRGENRLDIPRS